MSFRTSLFQNICRFIYSPTRLCHDSSEGIKYYGFTYYPRTKDFKDPPYEPSKLFLVTRHKSCKGTTKIEKDALQKLNIDGNKRTKGHMAVVKNIPSTNALLWKVKHLVTIKPITWKGELPKDGDFSGAYLRNTGELIMSPRLKLTSSEIEATEKYLSNKVFDRKYFKKYLRDKWDRGFQGDFQ